MIKAFKLKVELQDVEPKVWRSFVIPADTTFKRLHDTLIKVMGWRGEHLYEFEKKMNDLQYLQVSMDEAYEEFQMRKQYYIECEANGTELHEFDKRWYLRSKRIQMKKASTYKLTTFFKEIGDTINYRYDFGDDWLHTITLETIVEGYPVGYPMLLDFEGNCPPEDVGGSGGFEHFLEAWNDPKHPEHESMRDWGKNNYVEFNRQLVNFDMSQSLIMKRMK